MITMRPDGSGLRQLTSTRGFHEEAAVCSTSKSDRPSPPARLSAAVGAEARRRGVRVEREADSAHERPIPPRAYITPEPGRSRDLRPPSCRLLSDQGE